MRLLLIVFALSAVLLALALWFTSSGRSRAHSADSIEISGVEIVADEFVETHLDDPNAPAIASDSSVARTGRSALEQPVAAPVPLDPIDHAKPSAPLEGKVIDERSGLALPRYLLRLEDTAGRRFETLTGDDGTFKTATPLAIGVVRVTPLDHPRRRQVGRVMEVDHIANRPVPKVLSIDSGPTYTVTFGPAIGPDLTRVDLRLSVANEEARETTPYEPLRAEEPYCLDGEGTWVRFPAFDPDFIEARSIDARTRDGLWVGRAPATAAVGRAAEVVHIELAQRAVVTGVVTHEGAPVPGVVVNLRMKPKEGGRRPNQSTARTDNKGRYRMEYVTAGEATLRTHSIRHDVATAEITVRSGEVCERDFELAELPTVGRIAGVVASETGTYEPRTSIALVKLDDSSDPPRLRTSVRWQAGKDGREGRFDFGALPKGKYRLDVEENDWYDWSPRRVTVEAPKEDVVFLVKDGVLTSDFAFDVRDVDNGLALRRFHLVLETFEGERSIWSDSGSVVLTNYPEDKRLRWRLDKAGYPAQIGDMKHFTVRTISDGRPRRTCEISMQPGWGDFLRVTRRRDNKPVAGAVVSIAEREVGKTDADGVMRVTARTKPAEIKIAFEGWRVGGGIDLRPPSQRNFRRHIGVGLVPVPKKKP